MFCLKCGAAIEEGSLFCPECGTRVEEMNDFAGVNQSVDTSVQAAPKAVSSKVKKPLNKKAIVIVAAILFYAILAIIIISTVTSRVSVNKYINAENLVVSGYNGYGVIENSARSVIDKEGLENALGAKKSKSSGKSDDYGFLDDDYDFFDDDYEYDVFDYIDVDFRDDKPELLSNGDEIFIDIKINYDKINDIGYKKKLTGKKEIELKYTVSGLEEITSVDPFSCIEKIYVDCTTDYISLNIKYNENNDITNMGYTMESNSDGNCKFYMNTDDEVTNQFYLSFASTDILDDLKTGDKYNVIVETESELGRSGIELSSTSKEYSADCLNHLEDESKIQTSLVSEMKQYIEKKTEKKVASQYFYYYKDWNEENKSFKEVSFLVKGEHGYNLYNYSADNFKISDSGDIIVNFDGYHESYRSFGKIKDFEDEYSSDPEYSTLKKIILS